MEIRNLIGHNGNSIKNQFVIVDKDGNIESANWTTN